MSVLLWIVYVLYFLCTSIVSIATVVTVRNKHTEVEAAPAHLDDHTEPDVEPPSPSKKTGKGDTDAENADGESEATTQGTADQGGPSSQETKTDSTDGHLRDKDHRT
jgi:hypothetical protein